MRDTRNLLLIAGGQRHLHRFTTDVGYLTRNGVSSLRAVFGPKFYPKRGLVRRIETSLNTEQTRDAYSGIWESYSEASAFLRFRGAYSWRFGYHVSERGVRGRGVPDVRVFDDGVGAGDRSS